MLRKVLSVVLIAAFCSSLFAGDVNYIDEKKAAQALFKQKKVEEALNAYSALAEKDISDVQKADALHYAIDCAMRLKNKDKAKELAEKITDESYKAYETMRVLNYCREYDAVIEKYKDTDLSKFPELIRGNSYYERGFAFKAKKMAQEAKADLEESIKYIRNANKKALILNHLAAIYYGADKDSAKAIETYRSVYPLQKYKGAQAAMAVAKILAEEGKFDEAMAEMEKIDKTVKPHRVFKWMIKNANADLFKMKGDKEKSISLYKEIMDASDSPAYMKKVAERTLIKLGAIEAKK